MDSLEYANLVQNPPQSDYRKNLYLYEQGKPIENVIADHDQILSAAQNDANQYAILAKHLLKDPPLLDPAYQQKQLQLKDQQTAAAKAKLTKLQNQVNIDESKLKNLKRNYDAIVQTRNIRKNVAAKACREGNQLKDYVHTRDRVILINEAAAQQKEKAIRQLSIIIYLILYAMILGVAMAVGYLPAKTMGYLTLAGVLIAVYFILSDKHFLKDYGDFSMDVAKGAVRGAVKAFGWEKKCPKKCRPKHGDLPIINPVGSDGEEVVPGCPNFVN